MLAELFTDEDAPDRFEYHREMNEQIGGRPADAIVIEGYAVEWGVLDEEKEIIYRGAFAQSLKLSKGAYGVLMHYQHLERHPIGRWSKIVEDDHGLFCRGAIYPRLCPLGLVHEVLKKHDPIRGLSPGFFYRNSTKGIYTTFTRRLIRREVRGAWLMEVSVGRGPVQPSAAFTIVNR